MSRHNFGSLGLLQLKQVMVIIHKLRKMASEAEVADERGCDLELAVESPGSPIIGRPPPRLCTPPGSAFGTAAELQWPYTSHCPSRAAAK
jgi:hypothetical protein